MGTRRVGVSVKDSVVPGYVMLEKTITVSLEALNKALAMRILVADEAKTYLCPLGCAATAEFNRPAYATRSFLHMDAGGLHPKSQIWVAKVGLDRDRHNNLLELFDNGRIEVVREILEKPLFITYTKPSTGN